MPSTGYSNRLRMAIRYIGGTVAVVGAAVTIGVVGSQVGTHTAQVPPPNVTEASPRLDLLASTDLGALPERGTSAGQFCGDVGTLGTPDSCWEFGSAGTITDQGSNGWDLTATGSPRTGLETGLPVYDGASVTWTGEQAVGLDTNSDYYTGGSQDQPTDDLVSVTAMYNTTDANYGNVWLHYTSPTGLLVRTNTADKCSAQVFGAFGRVRERKLFRIPM